MYIYTIKQSKMHLAIAILKRERKKLIKDIAEADEYLLDEDTGLKIKPKDRTLSEQYAYEQRRIDKNLLNHINKLLDFINENS